MFYILLEDGNLRFDGLFLAPYAFCGISDGAVVFDFRTAGVYVSGELQVPYLFGILWLFYYRFAFFDVNFLGIDPVGAFEFWIVLRIFVYLYLYICSFLRIIICVLSHKF